MSNAQTWTVIGAFLAVLVAMGGLVLALVRAEIAVLRVELAGLREHIDTRLDTLERDLQRLYEFVFPGRAAG